MPITCNYDAGSSTVNMQANGIVTSNEILTCPASVLADENMNTG